MADVTLIAQPRNKKPLVSAAALERGEYVARKKGTFGVIWFTDLGAAVWETCLQTHGEARIKLADRGFDELNWTVYFKMNLDSGTMQVRLEAILYKGKIGRVTNTYCLLKIRHDDKGEIRAFVTKLHEVLGHYPLGFKYPGELENTTDKTPAMIKEDWESILGHKIDRPDLPPKGRKPKGKGEAADKVDGEEKPKKPAKERKFGFAASLEALKAKAGMAEAEAAQEAADGEPEAETEPDHEFLECPECGAEVPLPTEGNLIKCPDCGLEGEAPERLEPVVFECPACDGDIEIWTQAMPAILECPHCGVSGSLGEAGDEDQEDRAGDEAESPDETADEEVEKSTGKDVEATPAKESSKPLTKANARELAEVELKSEDDRGGALAADGGKTEPLVRPGTAKPKPVAKAKPAAKKPAAKKPTARKPAAKAKAKPKEVKPPTGPKGEKLNKHGKLEGLWIFDKYYLISPSKVKYDRELMEKAQELVDGHTTHQITVDDCEALYEKVADASKYTDCEKRTMKYIRDNFKFTPAADKKFRHMIASWAAQKAAKTRKANEEAGK